MPLCLNTVRQNETQQTQNKQKAAVSWHSEAKQQEPTNMEQKKPLRLNTVRQEKTKQEKSNNSQSRCASTQT